MPKRRLGNNSNCCQQKRTHKQYARNCRHKQLQNSSKRKWLEGDPTLKPDGKGVHCTETEVKNKNPNRL